MIYYSETDRFYTRFWNDISQLILSICLHKGRRYELRPAIPAKSLSNNETNKLICNRKVLGARKLFSKHIKPYLKLFDIFWHIAKNWFATLSTGNYSFLNKRGCPFFLIQAWQLRLFSSLITAMLLQCAKIYVSWKQASWPSCDEVYVSECLFGNGVRVCFPGPC